MRLRLLLGLGLLLPLALGIARAADEAKEEVRRAQASDKAAGLKKKDRPSETKPEGKEKPSLSPGQALLPWAPGLNAGLQRALAERKPILVRIEASGCPWCRKLEEEIKKPDVQKELGRWTLVTINQDNAPDEADELGVGPVPALRILTAGGQMVASRDGYQGQRELIAWLAEHFKTAEAAPDDALVAATPPDAGAVVRLLRHFPERNPALREAAIRRLLPYPDVARKQVVRAFRDGPLATKLAAMELLVAWKAPVQSLDPWRPETLTQEALSALDQWVEKASPNPIAAEKLTDEQLADARRQIDRMLKAAPAEADAIRERLARLGAALQPEVYGRLKQAATDQQRELLLALRYRLVASNALVLRWPGGVVRLASIDLRQRQQAAEELANLVTADDQELLLELFSDPDPMVRETSLRGLQHIGGKEATGALVKLLDDPQPNVRAAVLKQLAENPSRLLVPQIAAYVAKEKDADLIVHAIRFLREAHGPQAAKCLTSLLTHAQWQVRAEAAEALGKALSGRGEGDLPNELKADGYAALIGLLDDADAFVVSRAVEGLSDVDTDIAVEPLVRAAGKHPDLMPTIIEMLARSEKVRTKALPHLRSFAKDKSPAARAAAIKGLVEAIPDELEEELTASLKDPESPVRVAAAAALFGFFDRQRENPEEFAARRLGERLESRVITPGEVIASGVVKLLFGKKGKNEGQAESAPPKAKSEEPKVAEKKQAESKAAPGKASEEPDESSDRWLEKFYSGEGRPKWMAKLVEPLEAMLAAQAPEEKIEAALALIPLGQSDRALPVLLATVRAQPRLLARAASVLPWLTWQKRLETFRELRPLATEESDAALVLSSMAQTPDRRAADLYWQLLADPKLSDQTASVVHQGLQQAYYGRNEGSGDGVPASRRKELAKVARPHTATGSELERLVALVLLADADPETAAEVAAPMAEDAKLSQELRLDAFQITLVLKPKAEAMKSALAALSGDDLERRKRALTYLVDSGQGLQVVRKQFYLTVGGNSRSFTLEDGAGVPQAPRGIRMEHLRPLLAGSDPQIAAYAGYLAALRGEAEGLGPLLRYWRQEGAKPAGFERLVYRAIAALDDSSQIPALQQIAEKMQPHEARDFYWTIRVMTGPEILKFRKQLRDKFGADNLR